MRFISKQPLQVRVSNTVGDAIHTIRLCLSNQVGNLLAKLLAVLEGVVHAVDDVGIELLIRVVAELDFAVNTVLLSSTNDAAGDNNRNLADTADVGVQPAVTERAGAPAGERSTWWWGGGEVKASRQGCI